MKLDTITMNLCCALLLGLTAGCDLGDEDPESLVLEAEDDAEQSSPQLEFDALAAEPNGVAINHATTYVGHGRPSGLNDGDIVMIKNYSQGYLGCFDGTPRFAHGPYNIDNYVWQFHETDINGDGTLEFQFELIDSTGLTNTFLKMSNAGEIYCGPITGIGDAAAWQDDPHSLRGNGSHYRKLHFQIENYKQGLCIQGSSSTSVDSRACADLWWNMAFWVEVVA